MENINIYKTKKLQKYLNNEIDNQKEFTGIGISKHILLCGSTGSGKTNALLNYLILTSKPKLGTFSHIFLCYKTQEPLYDFLKDELKNNLTEYKNLDEFPSVNEFPEQTIDKYLIIFDDCVNDKDKKSEKKINEYFTYGRKKGITCLFLSQSYYDTLEFIRKNVSYIILCSIQSNNDLYRILSEYSISDVNKKEMLKMYEYAVLKRNPDDMPFMKISRNETKNKKFSRNWTDYINIDDYKK